MLKFKPLSNYVVCDIIEKQTGKIIALDKKRLPRDRVEFIVLAVSEDKNTNGEPMVKNIKVGDNIIPDTTQGLGTVLNIGKKEVMVIRETQILGILQPGYDEVEDEAERQAELNGSFN